MEKQRRERTRMGTNTFSGGLRLPELISHVERLMLSSEKKRLRDTLLLLEKENNKPDRKENNKAVHIVREFGQRLCDNSLSDDHLRTVLKLYQYHLHEVSILQDLQETCARGSCENKDESNDLRLPKLPNNQSPLRPTALLDRVLDKHKMEREIVIPTMVLKDSSSNRSFGTSHMSAQSGGDRNEKKPRQKHLPHFNYAHGEGMGTRRNLPGQPELIRMLTDPELSLGGNETTHSNNIELNRKNSISLLSLYAGTTGPPLIEKEKQRRPRKRRIVCKFCRRPPGDHQKWCIYFDFGKINEETPLDLARANTEDEISLTKNVVNKIPEPERSKTSLDDYVVRPELPDYRPLHRDIYIRALADARGRLVMKRTHDFMNQLTRPFVFSYFARLNGPKFRSQTNGMKHIFGEENTDFTQYYKLFVNEIKLDKKHNSFNTKADVPKK